MARFTSEVVGKPFQLGGFGNPGYDCLTLIQKFVHKINPGLIDQFGGLGKWEYAGLSVEDYAWIFQKDPETAREILFCWLHEITDEVERALPGDILLAVFRRQEVINPVIHAGNDRLLLVFDTRGVGLIGKKLFEIVKALRIKGA
jgi:hypothetical protein